MAEDNKDGQSSGDDTGKTPEELKQMFEDQKARAEKAEAALKVKEDAEKAAADEAKKKADAEAASKNQNINVPATDPDELRLIARGLSDKEIEQLHVISKGTGKSLMESLKDPLFVSFQKDLKEQEAKEKAKLGGSNSSSQGQDQESPVKPGMTDAEHKDAWKKVMGK